MKKIKQIIAIRLAKFYELKKDILWKIIRVNEALLKPEDCINALIGSDICNIEIIDRLKNEIYNNINIRSMVEYYLERYKDVVIWTWEQRFSGRQYVKVLFLYILLRLLKPEKVIETGCFSGWTSTLILLALHHNQKGHLWSIDIPAKAGYKSMSVGLPPDLEPGFLVPEELRSRWTLIIGDVKDHLLPLCQKIGPIDVFYHDSDHTYDHMMWEYTSIWPWLRIGGILISDDINRNTAFWDFTTAIGVSRIIYKENINFGALCKK